MSNVVPAAILGPTYYRSSYASSDNVMLIICDVGTTWLFAESERVNGVATVPYSMVDVFGIKTPRQLASYDIDFTLTDRYHILAYDIDSGRTIDFFSPLNWYYFNGYESWPTNGITNGFRPAP